jgi:hypothetical protein
MELGFKTALTMLKKYVSSNMKKVSIKKRGRSRDGLISIYWKCSGSNRIDFFSCICPDLLLSHWVIHS